MAFWLLKTEPGSYAFSDLEQERRAVWDGVANNWALQHLRSMRPGDKAFIYHSGKERSIAGVAEIVSQPYPDPALKDPKRTVVDVVPVKTLSGSVTLEKIKADPFFQDFMLVKFTRLSVMPVDERIWQRILEMEDSESI